MRVILLITSLMVAGVTMASQTCITSSDGITICSNPDGSWG